MNFPDPNVPKPSWIRWIEGKAELADGALGNLPDLVNTRDAATYLGIAQCTVNREVKRGHLSVAKKGGRGQWHLFRKADLDKYKLENLQEAIDEEML